jgi:hypothetical protein
MVATGIRPYQLYHAADNRSKRITILYGPWAVTLMRLVPSKSNKWSYHSGVVHAFLMRKAFFDVALKITLQALRLRF